VSVPEL
jgi:hypothetical protein